MEPEEMAPTALSFHRLANRLRSLGVPVIPSVLHRVGHHSHRSHIDPDAELGEGVELGYGGIGVVIAAGVKVGRNSFLAQDVTLGPATPGGGVPCIGEGVLLGTGAKVLGPVSVGDRAQIGANAVVTEDVPPGAVVIGVPGRIR
jgi:serine O-acetyltransferase